ncbi:MAG: ABC transporter permease, partial [bacterium]|nr:ABC transporter permease [bacterium]
MILLSWIARRTVQSGRKALFIRFFSFIGIGGIALGVFSLIVVLSIMNGFSNDLSQKVMGFDGMLTVRGEEAKLLEVREHFKKEKGLVSHLYYEGEGIAQSEIGETLSVKVRGVEPDDPRLETLLHAEYDLAEGGETLFKSESGEGGVLVGMELASTLSVHPSFDDDLLVISPVGSIGPSGEFLPRLKSFRVTGLFRSGYFDYDNQYLFISYEAAKKLFPGLAGSSSKNLSG